MEKPPPATVPGAANKNEEVAAAAAPAAQTFASGGAAGSRPPKRARDDSGDVDFISNLPDEILGTIVSLLPTKDGGRTQAIARRWRPLWRSAPLNIDAHNLASRYPPRREGPRPRWRPLVSRILSDHPGPVRRLDFRRDSTCSTKRRYDEDVAHFESWLNSGKLGNLQELHILFPFLFRPTGDDWKLYRMPSCVLRFASTVITATIGLCDFPNEIAPSLNFPLLKHLTLKRVSMSEDIFHRVLSACHVLETLFLELEQNDGMASLHISSATLRSIACLERLICTNLDFETNIRVNRAPKLEMLGPFSPYNFNIQIGKLVFQGLIPTSSPMFFHQVGCSS
ncbi:unnamed protein product [Alopecurus aequalis]